jgi:hypothetical protein
LLKLISERKKRGYWIGEGRNKCVLDLLRRKKEDFEEKKRERGLSGEAHVCTPTVEGYIMFTQIISKGVQFDYY